MCIASFPSSSIPVHSYPMAPLLQVCCDYALKMALPRIDAETLEEMEELTTSEYGVNIFHLSMAGNHMLKDNQLLDAMEKVSSEVEYALYSPVEVLKDYFESHLCMYLPLFIVCLDLSWADLILNMDL